MHGRMYVELMNINLADICTSRNNFILHKQYLLYPKYGGSKSLRNVVIFLQNYSCHSLEPGEGRI